MAASGWQLSQSDGRDVGVVRRSRDLLGPPPDGRYRGGPARRGKVPRGQRAAVSQAQPALSIEATPGKAADRLRGSLDASDYKHVVLGLSFLKYVEDAFSERYRVLEAELEAGGADSAELPPDRQEAAVLLVMQQA